MGKLAKGVGNILRDYSGWTGTHGVPHIGMAQNMCLRVFWSVVFVVSMGMFMWQMSVLLKQYFAYNVNVETELKFSERVFPAVTTCHLNPWKVSEIEGTDIETLIEKYKNALTGVTSDTELSDWGFVGLTNSEIQKRALRWSTIIGSELNLGTEAFMVGNLTLGYNYSAAYNYSDLVMNCAYNTEGCNVSDFLQTYDPQFGLCYTFNYDERYNSSRAGPLYGLRMLMRVYQQEYLPWTEGSGVVVAIHGQNENPFADVFGYFAPPGTAASMGVRFVQTSRLPAPYGECTETQGSQPYYYNGTYLMEGCFRSCIQDKIVASCGCYDPAYAPPDDDSVVSCASYSIPQVNQKIDCINKLINGDSSAGNSSSAFNVIDACTCPQPCEESTYSVTVSTALWPSDVYRPPECNDADLAAQYWPDGDCLGWYKDNTLLVEVYYERMNYQLLSESAAYTIVNMVSDVGGQLGLWIGASLISVIEFLTLLVLLCCYCCTRVRSKDFDDDEVKKSNTNQAYDSDDSDDERPNTASTNLDGIYKHDKGTESVIPPKIKD